MTTSDQFYIGYNKTAPPAYASRARFASILLLLAAITLGILNSRAQHDAGGGNWDTGQYEWTGLLFIDPYPLLVVDDTITMILVAEGKHGLGARAKEFVGKGTITVRGTQISRSSRKMIEVLDDPGAITDSGNRRISSPISSPSGTINLTGEVIDPKCYLGAMKPGRGKTHRACAIRCISGGIPPALLTDSNDVILLADQSGNPINEAILPFVADHIRVRAEITTIGDLRIARIDATNIARD